MSEAYGEHLSPDVFRHVVDRYRCSAVDEPSGEPCQLYQGHDIPHVWAGYVRPGRGRAYVQPDWVRWDDTGRWTQPSGSERLPWCCMYRTRA